MSSRPAMSCSLNVPSLRHAPFHVFVTGSSTCVLLRCISRRHAVHGRSSAHRASACNAGIPCDKARHDASPTAASSRVTHNCFARRFAGPTQLRPRLTLANSSLRPRIFLNHRRSRSRHATTPSFLVCSLSSLFTPRKPRAGDMEMPALIETAQIGRAWSSNGRNRATRGRG
jgi:hypothetical protein